MKINKQYVSNNNSYPRQNPIYIVIHNTDNYSAGANAKAHASAQYNGNFEGYSAHIYVDDKTAYQSMPYDRGAWHVGVDYGGRLFETVNNRNSVAIEMCVQSGYDYEKAFANTVNVCKQLMEQFDIPAERVVQHYDVCAKNCPSAIRDKRDWERFQRLIKDGSFAMKNNFAKNTDMPLTVSMNLILPELSVGCGGSAVSMLQAFLQVETDGIFGVQTQTALCQFQRNTGQSVDGICGKNSWTAIAEHMKQNTFVT